MGKKSKILYLSVLIVNIICFILDLLPINFPFFRISFSVSLMLIGIVLFVRSVTLKIDSSMFIGNTLFLLGVINFTMYFLQVYKNVDSNQFWPYYLFALAIASLITGLYFKDKFQFKLFTLFLGFGIIVLLFTLDLINLWWMIGLLVAYFVLYFVINMLIFRKRRKNG